MSAVRNFWRLAVGGSAWGACLGIGMMLGGCNSSATPPMAAAETQIPGLDSSPLTVEIWQKNSGPEKFEPEVLSRLRADNEQIKSEEAWKKFSDEVLKPEFQKEVGIKPPESFNLK